MTSGMTSECGEIRVCSQKANQIASFGHRHLKLKQILGAYLFFTFSLRPRPPTIICARTMTSKSSSFLKQIIDRSTHSDSVSEIRITESWIHFK